MKMEVGQLLTGAIFLITVCDVLGYPDVNYTIVEEKEARAYVGTIVQDAQVDKLYEQDVLQALKFEFLDSTGTHINLFHVEPETGILTTASRVDREQICPGKETCIVAFDIAIQPRKYFSVIKVSVLILDLNDRPPSFPKEEITVEISESTQIEAKFPIPLAKDADSPENGVEKYYLAPKSRDFDISGPEEDGSINDLYLLVKQLLDRETKATYRLTLLARDKGTPPLTGTLTVNVLVIDANDNKPLFNSTNYRFRIAESIANGTIVGRVWASDKDYGLNGKVAYAFTEHTIAELQETFGITEHGDIYTKAPLDFEKTKTYTLSVKAFDTGQDSLSSFTKVTISVTDVNDNKPVIKVNTLTGGDTGRVMENQKEGSFVAHAAVSDLDSGANNKVSCSIDTGKFELAQIHMKEFKIVTAGQLDREREPNFSIMLNCKDAGEPSLESSKKIIIQVLDENDNRPKFLGLPYIVRVQENDRVGLPLINVSANDADAGANGLVKYRLLGTPNDYISLDQLSGLISTKTALDYEANRELEFQIIAYDNGSPPLSTTTTLTISILDRNDEPPTFQKSIYYFDVFENKAAGTKVGVVSAVDLDSSPLNKFEYSIDTSDEAGHRFYINPDTGIIRTRTTLDREANAYFDITVVATEVNPPHANGTSKTKIYLLDTNDNPPIIDFPNPFNNTVTVGYNMIPDYKFTRIGAHDDDMGKNAKLTYSVDRDYYNGSVFQVDSTTGYVSFKYVPTFEGNVYSLRIMVGVSDNGDPKLRTEAEMYINLDRSRKFTPPLIPMSSRELEPLLSKENFIIIICVSVAFGILILFLVVILVISKRRGNEFRHGDYRYCGTSKVEVRLLDPQNKGVNGLPNGWAPLMDKPDRSRSGSFVNDSRGDQTQTDDRVTRSYISSAQGGNSPVADDSPDAPPPDTYLPTEDAYDPASSCHYVSTLPPPPPPPRVCVPADVPADICYRTPVKYRTRKYPRQAMSTLDSGRGTSVGDDIDMV